MLLQQQLVSRAGHFIACCTNTHLKGEACFRHKWKDKGRSEQLLDTTFLYALVGWKALGENSRMLALVAVTQGPAQLIWKLFLHLFEPLEYRHITRQRRTANSSFVSDQLQACHPQFVQRFPTALTWTGSPG